jgi:TatA/E family protein of Tat protein translocase
MGPLGVPEMIFIFVLALLILGPKKLPEVGRAIGKGMAEFRRASNELKSTFEREMSTLEQESQSLKEITSDYSSHASTASTTTGVSGVPYEYPYDDYSHSQESTPSVSAPEAADSHSVVHKPEEGSNVVKS